VNSSEKFLRVIVRRPHAYEFREKYRGKDVPIPGLLVLSADGKLVGTSALESSKEVTDKLDGLAK
jgi:hypothetical protein